METNSRLSLGNKGLCDRYYGRRSHSRHIRAHLHHHQYHVGDDFPSTAISTVWNKLQQLTYGVEYRFGKGTSKLPVAASVLASLGEKYYEKRKTICHDLRYLPNDKDYPVFLSYWQSEVYGKYKDDIPKMEVVGE